jgi:hypothetical protein
MVLKLKDICLTCIAKEFDKIENFNSSLLHAAHKEIIIELLANHGLLEKRPSSASDSNATAEIENATYQQALIDYFFEGHLKSLRFNYCEQLSNKFLTLVAKQASSRLDEKKLIVNSLKIVGCKKVTG